MPGAPAAEHAGARLRRRSAVSMLPTSTIGRTRELPRRGARFPSPSSSFSVG
jgi:hypothetical protein